MASFYIVLYTGLCKMGSSIYLASDVIHESYVQISTTETHPRNYHGVFVQ
jgi:hypothetical protein